jgi:hypothetical protein
MGAIEWLEYYGRGLTHLMSTHRKTVSERITWPRATNVQGSFRSKTRTQSITTHSRANVRIV